MYCIDAKVLQVVYSKKWLLHIRISLIDFNWTSVLVYWTDDIIPDYGGRFTVPVLWDKQKETIVSNESSEIIRMLNTEFNEFIQNEEKRKLDLYPEHLRADIDAVNAWIYP